MPSSFVCVHGDTIRFGVSARAPVSPSAARLASEKISSAMKTRRLNGPSLLQRFIDQFLERLLNALTLGRCHLHQQKRHLLLGIDDEIRAARAVPLQLAEIAGWRRLGISRIRPDTEAEAKTKP